MTFHIIYLIELSINKSGKNKRLERQKRTSSDEAKEPEQCTSKQSNSAVDVASSNRPALHGNSSDSIGL